MKESLPQDILNLRGNRRQFVKFAVGVGIGAVTGLIANSQEVSAGEEELPSIGDNDNAHEVAASVGLGALGAGAGTYAGAQKAEQIIEKWKKEGKTLTVLDDNTAPVVVGSISSIGGLALGGGLGAGIGYGASKIVKRIA